MTREIKTIGGKEYAYEVSMVWDLDHKKRHKTSKYLGKIVDGKATRIREVVAVKGVYEIGHLELVWSVMSDLIGILRKTFPDDRDCVKIFGNVPQLLCDVEGLLSF